jgi:2'-5' RNA ligase superfamily
VPLLLMTPDADELVARWRADHDWAARYGVTAHVTVRLPFLEPNDWHTAARVELARLLPVELTLCRLEERPGGLVVLVEPDDRLRELTDTIGDLWPSLPSHKANYDRPAYHVTVVRTPDPDVRREAAEAIVSLLPMEVTGTAFWAACGSPAQGIVHSVLAEAADR